ncbi:MAG TPA: glutamate--tRNA ligase family protein [Candidatus Saccharimonadales bacterium]|jgi:glutamyl/glutaminyl-tRNA synthetase|nr:glutamate--tRNA ligase family protein [Candidatus Saccharimonadales bacterium]
MTPYRGRIAPSPTGYLHLGHARTFWIAWQRARANSGTLVFRNEDLDRQRCKPEFVTAMYEDLRWLGLDWQEGPDTSGPFHPYSQSERYNIYLEVWRRLRDGGFIFPCSCSRKDLERALSAPHEDDELPYPGVCREKLTQASQWKSPAGISWRFKVPDGETVSFTDLRCGEQQFTAGRDFSDFLVWRRDDVPAYQLAVVADDEAMRITEVVRGADLLKSTARQILLLRALGYSQPQYFHCDLMRDANNIRLAKRHDALSLRTLRARGADPGELRGVFACDAAVF